MKRTMSCTIDDETDLAVKRYCKNNGCISEAAFLRQAIAEKLEWERQELARQARESQV